jgi:hypothetical protein
MFLSSLPLSAPAAGLVVEDPGGWFLVFRNRLPITIVGVARWRAWQNPRKEGGRVWQV